MQDEFDKEAAARSVQDLEMWKKWQDNGKNPDDLLLLQKPQKQFSLPLLLKKLQKSVPK